MESLTKELIRKLLSAYQAPYLSLYMPTFRTHPENLKNSIRFDDLGELVIKMGGHVMVIPTDKMPSETGLAAIFRY